MIERSLWELQVAEPRNSVVAYLLAGFSFQTDLLKVELNNFPDGVAWCDLAVDSIDSKLILDSIEISLGDFDLQRRNVPAFMPNEASFLFVINFFLHRDFNIELCLGVILFQLNGVLWLENFEDLVLILFVGPLNGEVAIDPPPFFALWLHRPYPINIKHLN